MKNLYRTVLIALLACSGFAGFSLPKLSSFPSATSTLFLDFDGHYVRSIWNGGNPIDCAAAPLTDAQMTEIFNRVAEDFRPFNLNITTDSTVFLAAPIRSRMRVIITPTNYWYQGAGGVAYLNTFTRGDDTPCFVFSNMLGPNNAKFIAEAASHEAGHTMGLSHQAQYDASCALVNVYNPGTGSGQIAWAPIMGNSYSRNMSLWNFGPTQSSCIGRQDNLLVITSYNGFTYRADDHGNSTTAATLVNFNVDQFSQQGIISQTNDADMFRFDFGGNVVFSAAVVPYSVSSGNNGANLDVKLTLLNASGEVLRVYDSTSVLDAKIDTTLYAGTYYVMVDGTGNVNTNNDYGSLGSYTMAGTFQLTTVLAIREVKLSGEKKNGKHRLQWSVNADEEIAAYALEYSQDGTHFESLAELPGRSRSFEHLPLKKGNYYYRVKATGSRGEYRYSNILSLVSEGLHEPFRVQTWIQGGQLRVTAAENYRYLLVDLNGRILQQGQGKIGTQDISIGHVPGGMYILRLQTGTYTRTEKIIKQ